MGIFTKDHEAKARRTQEREEQQKKANTVPTPYVHTPTHAFNDSLLSVPHVHNGTDKRKLKEAHHQRLEREACAIAAGSDTNVTNIPAKYWQGQPLPAQFEAPTPANLRKLALSNPALKGKNIVIPKAAPTPTDSGYASGLSGSAKGPSCEQVTNQSQQDEAAEAGREAELERLRRRIRELEGEQTCKQNEQHLVGHPPVLTKETAQSVHNTKIPVRAGPHSAPAGNVGSLDGFKSRTSASDRLKLLYSDTDEKWSEAIPSTSQSIVAGLHEGGVNRYDWAIHWARINARTTEERDKLPQAVDPQERPVLVEEDKTCYASPDEFNHKFLVAPKDRPSSSSRNRRTTNMPEPFGSESDSPDTSVVVQTPAGRRKEARHRPAPSPVGDIDFGFDSTPSSSTLRPDKDSTRTVSHVDKADSRRKRQ